MTSEIIEQVGLAITLESNERSTPGVDLGKRLVLERGDKQTIAHEYSWYLQGDFGTIGFRKLYGDKCLEACVEFAERNGFKAAGELPPECFEYVR